MKLDEMTEKEIEDAEALGDLQVIAEMEARLRRVVEIIRDAGDPKQMVRLGIPNSPANQLVCKRAEKQFPDIAVGIRIA